VEIYVEKYAIIGESINEYIDILAKTIIQDYIVNNEEFFFGNFSKQGIQIV
jgi:hypothetical protein